MAAPTFSRRTLLTASVAAVTLAGCAPRGGGTGGGSADELSILSFRDDYTPLEEQTVDAFNEASDVTLSLDSIPSTQYTAKLRAVIDTQQAPDIIYSWGGGSIRQYVEDGLLMSLDETSSAESSLSEDFLESPFQAGQIDGVQYGIPNRGMNPVVMYYNKTLLQELGIEVPQTWDELASAVSVLKDNDKTPIVVAGQDPWTELMWVEYAYDRFAGEGFFQRLVAGENDLWASPESIDALGYVQELLDREAFGANFGSVSYNAGGAPQLFASGRAGFQLQLASEYGSQLASAPDFVANDLGWAPVPAITEGKGDPTNIVGNPTNYFSIVAGTKNADACVEFLKLMSSDDYVDGLIAGGALPATKSAGDRLEELPGPDFAAFEFDLIQNAPSFQLSWDQALKVENQTPMYTNLQQFFNGQFTAQQFGDAMAGLS